jgi:adenylate cyclase
VRKVRINGSPHRRMAAILAADVVGFSRMMEVNEAGTLSGLRACRRELINPAVQGYGGRVVKETGDGVLAEFPSVVNAVWAAIRIQLGSAKLCASPPITLRVGINLGDVIVEKGDLFGDGVNVAARLEAMAEPGGICISGAVFEQIHGKVPHEFTPLGEQRLKNIRRAVEVYALNPDMIASGGEPPPLNKPVFGKVGQRIALVGLVVATLVAVAAVIFVSRPAHDPSIGGIQTNPAAIAENSNAQRPPFSIVVLPFTNLSGDPSQEDFVDGLTEDLTTDLSRIAGSLVIARNTAFMYKGKPVDVKAIGRELSVRYVLEGSARRTGDMVRVNAQLIDTQSGLHLWAERFDENVRGLFELGDRISSRIARSLDLQLVEAESRRTIKDADPEAADLAMRGWAMLNRPRSPANTLGSADLFQQALQLDPDNMRAGLGLARASYFITTQRLVDNPALLLDRAETLARRAVALEPSSGLAHNVLSDVLVGKKRLEEAVAEMRKAVELNRNDAGAWGSIGYQLMLLGRFEEAFEPLQHAIQISPRDPSLWVWRMWTGLRAVALGDLEEGLRWVRSAAQTNSQVYPLYLYYTGVAGLAGTQEEARAALDVMRRLRPEVNLARVRAETPSDNPRYLELRDRIIDGLKRAGLPE